MTNTTLSKEEAIDMWSMFDKIYCIHFLPYKEERFEIIKAELERVGILGLPQFEWEFTVPNKFYDYVRVPKDKTKKGHGTITPATRPYAIQYYTLLKKCELMGYKNVLILEDDIAFMKDLGKLKKVLEATPVDWDIVNYDPFRRRGWLGAGKGYWGHYYDLDGNEVPYNYMGDEKFLRYNSVVYQTSAIAYSAKAITHVLNKMEECFVPMDWYTWMGTDGLNTYCTSGYNNICVQNKTFYKKLTGDGYASTFEQIYGKLDLTNYNITYFEMHDNLSNTLTSKEGE